MNRTLVTLAHPEGLLDKADDPEADADVQKVKNVDLDKGVSKF